MSENEIVDFTNFLAPECLPVVGIELRNEIPDQNVQVYTMLGIDGNNEIQMVSANEEEVNNNNDLKELLNSWGLEKCYNCLKAGKVDIEILKIIKWHHIKDLMKEFAIGEQILFESKIEEWRTSIGIPMPLPMPIRTYSPTNSVYSQPSSPEPSETAYIGLSSILEQKKRGKQLIDYYNENQMLQEKQRNLLIDLISRYFVDENIPLSLAATHRLEKEILERFPNEQQEFYRVGRRGKIYMKYFNAKRALKSLNTNKKVNSPEIKKKKIFCPEQGAESCINSLKFDDLSMEEFDSIWQACAQYRLKEIMDATNQEEIFHNWPYYKKPNGYRLIDKDFNTLYPESASILTNWDISFKKLKDFFIANLKGNVHLLKNYQDGDCYKDSAVLCLMNCIHSYLFPTKQVVENSGAKNKKYRRYTIKDSQNAFLFDAGSTQELEHHINFLHSQGNAVQPFILALKCEYYVYLDNYKLKFNNLLRAIDICFKTFFLFNLKYPTACDNFWNAIEMCFYMKNVKKQCSSKIFIMLSELNKNE